MKKIVLASACVLALSAPAAFAQKAQPTDGASSQGNVGPAASEGGAMKGGATSPGTTGTSSRPSAAGDASTSGAPTGAAVNNTGTATEPGAIKDGVNKR